MKILITGGAGMIGRKLAQRLARDGSLAGRPITSVVLHDVVEAPRCPDCPFPMTVKVGDLSRPGEAEELVADRPDVIFHLAAVVSGEAELDFDKGYRINLDGTRYLFEAIRKAGNKPRVVFTSSIAVFGAPFPEAIGDEFFTTPLTSYGTQKAICELLLADYTRKGFLLHAAALDGEVVGPRRNLTMPGVSVTVGEQIEALRKVAGDKVVARIRREPDPLIMQIVSGWPRNFDARRAIELGFRADSSFEEIIRIHIEAELGGKIA
jgi:nucleoside-diphosphate-sugar epimerase